MEQVGSTFTILSTGEKIGVERIYKAKKPIYEFKYLTEVSRLGIKPNFTTYLENVQESLRRKSWIRNTQNF
jgi:hypothetical protein